MSKDEAHLILDRAKAGGLVPERYITEALVVTGDLTPHRPEPTQQVIESTRAWPYYATSHARTRLDAA